MIKVVLFKLRTAMLDNLFVSKVCYHFSICIENIYSVALHVVKLQPGCMLLHKPTRRKHTRLPQVPVQHESP